MTPHRWLVLALLLLAWPAGAQQDAGDALFEIELEVPDPSIIVTLGETGEVPFVLRDLSKDGAGSALPGQGNQAGLPHTVLLRTEPANQEGWLSLLLVPAIETRAGDVVTGSVQVQVTPAAREPFYEFDLVAEFTSTATGTNLTARAHITAYNPGVDAFNVQQPIGGTIEPQGILSTSMPVLNNALTPRTFHHNVTAAGCGMTVVMPPSTIIDSKAEASVPITIEGPDDRIWYFSQLCQAQIFVHPEGFPDRGQTMYLSVTVDGGYFDPAWTYLPLLVAIAAVVVFLVVKRRKERLEEEILGKPQKPWLIPVEQVYLKHLRRRDERAWYMVRHHLMEEEYQSALLWYKHYKQATRGERTKERLVLRHEQAYDRWKERWARKIARPERDVERLAAKLQRGLDREAKARLRKALRKHRSLVAKIKAAHEKKIKRVEERHEKEVRRAQKKGLAPPPTPVVDGPDYPPEPQMRRVLLADHRLQKTVDRARRKAIRKRGDLEVRFERKDARRLQRIRRKVQRIARKINDPDFIAEHPLLGDRPA